MTATGTSLFHEIHRLTSLSCFQSRDWTAATPD